MYYLPISREKVIEIQEIAEVTKKIREEDEEISTEDFFKKLEKIHIQGIPDIGKALFQSIEQLEPKEKVAFQLIVESGRGTISGLTEKSVKKYVEDSPPPPRYEIGDMLSFIELPRYIQDGIAKLDKWLK